MPYLSVKLMTTLANKFTTPHTIWKFLSSLTSIIRRCCFGIYNSFYLFKCFFWNNRFVIALYSNSFNCTMIIDFLLFKVIWNILLSIFNYSTIEWFFNILVILLGLQFVKPVAVLRFLFSSSYCILRAPYPFRYKS